MRKLLFLCAMLMTMGVSAQTSLAGREYYHPNILGDELNEALKDARKDITKARTEAIAKAEEKKGRKLTEKELAELDKEIDEAQRMMEALRTGMKTAITVTFKDEKNIVMKVDMKIDESVMKAAGIGWAKRKLIKMATAISPSQKGTYVQKGNLVMMYEGKDCDTLRLSDDGKFLTGKLDEKKKFKLSRIK